mgnify:CR=1 FL=1
MGKPANMPSYIYESIQRQYKGGKDYTIEDKKNVINWYKKKAKFKPNKETSANA